MGAGIAILFFSGLWALILIVRVHSFLGQKVLILSGDNLFNQSGIAISDGTYLFLWLIAIGSFCLGLWMVISKSQNKITMVMNDSTYETSIDYKLIEGKTGDAFCIGCRLTSPVNGMYYNQNTDSYYHVNCLPSNKPYLNVDNKLKKCPSCAEEIKFEALKCRYCGEIFDSSDINKQIEERNKLSKVEFTKHYTLIEIRTGDAFCIGCRLISPVNGMFYNQSTDSYYHINCLPSNVRDYALKEYPWIAQR